MSDSKLPPPGRLAGKAALITGADASLGKAVALAFAREGADVFLAYHNDEEGARDTERQVRQAGRRAVLMAGDIGQAGHCARVVEAAFEAFGRLELLVNNASYLQGAKGLEEGEAEDVERTFRVNIFSMFHLCRAAVSHMRAGGSIINTSSIPASQLSPALLPYAASKGAMLTFTKGLAALLSERGIRVNAVVPGPAGASLPPDLEGPAPLAPIYVLLASDEGARLTGGTYEVTGGRVAD